MGATLTQEQKDKIINLRMEGLSYWQIESLTGVTFKTVSKYCKLAGLPEINTRRKSTPEEREEAKTLYMMGYNIPDVAEKLNRRPQVITKWLKKMDVDLTDRKWQRSEVTEIPLLTIKPELKKIKRVTYEGKRYIDVSDDYM